MVLSLFSCGPSKPLDTPTSGSIVIVSDESFSPFIDSEVSTFNSLYRYAHLEVDFSPEQEAFRLFMSDSSRLIVASRKLNEDEEKYFASKHLFPVTKRIAVDALALVVNKENTDTLLTYSQLKDIFLGKTTSWNQISVKSNLDKIAVVFDHSLSSTSRFIKERFTENQDLPSNCFAVKSNPEVINYVAQNKNAIGVVGVNWISDGDDPVSDGFLKSISVVSVSPPDSAVGAGDFYLPFQAYIAKGYYPLCRDIFVISREGRTGLGTGFMAFLAGDKGQRIILKSAILPATMPVRIINIHQ